MFPKRVTDMPNFLILRRVYCAEGGAEEEEDDYDKEDAALPSPSCWRSPF